MQATRLDVPQHEWIPGYAFYLLLLPGEQVN